MAYAAFPNAKNTSKKTPVNNATDLDNFLPSLKQKNPYLRLGRYGFYIFIGSGQV